jgi:hypothetical protein
MVMFGSRTPAKAERLAAATGANAAGGSYSEALEFGEVIVIATRWANTHDVIAQAGSFRGKILLDCTNPETPDARGLVIGHTTSGAEEIAKWASGARVVKAFNHVYAELLDSDPRFDSGNATVFYCGDDREAKEVVAGLAREGGFDPVDAGPLRNARYLEPAAQLMVQLVRVLEMGPSNVAFKLLRRDR